MLLKIYFRRIGNNMNLSVILKDEILVLNSDYKLKDYEL